MSTLWEFRWSQSTDRARNAEKKLHATTTRTSTVSMTFRDFYSLITLATRRIEGPFLLLPISAALGYLQIAYTLVHFVQDYSSSERSPISKFRCGRTIGISTALHSLYDTFSTRQLFPRRERTWFFIPECQVHSQQHYCIFPFIIILQCKYVTHK